MSAGSRPAAAESVCEKLALGQLAQLSQTSLLHCVSSHLAAAEDPGGWDQC